MPDPSVLRKIDEVARLVRGLTPVDYPGEPDPPAPAEDLVALFDRRLNGLRAPADQEPAVLYVDDVEGAARAAAAICRGVKPAEILWHGEPPSDGPRDYAVGVTPAIALIAATGSVVVELPTATDGWSSLLVDRHVVVADRGHVLPDVPAYYRELHDRHVRGERLPIQICISGCSRTADIEKLLVVPAHGPRQVRVILSAVPLDWADLRRRVGLIAAAGR